MIDGDSLFGLPSALEHAPWIMRTISASTLGMVVTWIMVRAAEPFSAAIRCRILLLGLTGLLSLPVLIAITEGWQPTITFPAVATPALTVTSDHSSPDIAEEPAFPGPGREPSPARPVFDPIAPQSTANTPSVAIDLPEEVPIDRQLLHRSPMTNSDSRPFQFWRQSSVATAFHPGSLMVAVWTLVSLWLGTRLLLGWVWTLRIVRSAVPITDAATLAVLADAAQSIGRLTGRRTIPSPRLFCCLSTPVPFATGMFSPAIVLPMGFGNWPLHRLRVVLLHEFAHVARRDVASSLAALLACAVYWFNPLVWLAARRMELERERACDDWLVCLGEDPQGYANDLVEIATTLKSPFHSLPFVTPMATQSQLKSRVEHLLIPGLDRRPLSTRASLLTTLAAGILLTLLAAVSPSFAIAQEAPKRTLGNPNDVAVTLTGEFPVDWVEQLQAMPKLRSLTVRNPDLQTFQAAKLREFTQLTEFSAEDFAIDTKLADIVAVNIARLPRLKSIQFHRSGLTGRGLQALSQSTVSEMVLDGEELLADADFKHLTALSSLTDLVLDSTRIEADGLETLRTAPRLRRLALRRHPAGSYEAGSRARVTAIASFPQLETLELSDTGFSHLVPLKNCPKLKVLTLHNCGGADAAVSLQQLSQLQRVEFDDTDLWKESLDDVKAVLAANGVAYVDITSNKANEIAGQSAPPDEATQIARRALESLDVGRQFPAFWLEGHSQWSKIPSMTGEPVRTVHRLKQALSAPHEIQPWQSDNTYAHAPGQFLLRSVHFEKEVPGWVQTTYGDESRAWSREGRTGQPFLHVLRAGVREFEESMGPRLPRQLFVAPQHLWWGTLAHHNATSSPVSIQAVSYTELSAEPFAGELCRVFESPGRSERLWVSQSTGRLRGALHYIHQGYFAPFYKLEIVTKLLGRRVDSQEHYRQLLSAPNAVSAEVRQQLTQAWAEHEFQHAYPGQLTMLDDYREVTTGKWFPYKVSNSTWHHNRENESQYDYSLSEFVVTNLVVDRVDLEPLWKEYQPQVGETVQDQRYGVAVDYPFDKNRTEATIQELVNDRLLTLARSQIQIEAAQSPFTNMSGQPAPLLPAAEWIGDRPELAGKRYLIHFWADWCAPCKNDVPLLNALAKNRIVIGVHPADTCIDTIRQTMQKFEMAYPTVVVPRIDEKLSGYPVTMYPYCVEVDEQGRVAAHGFLLELTRTADNRPLSQPATAASASIMAVDERDGLAVLSQGETDGLQRNQLLDVVRDGQRIAQLRVLVIHKSRSVGKIVNPRDLTPLRVGDSAQ